MTVFCIRSLLNLILVHAVLNNFYFCSFSLLKFLYCLVFVSLQLEKKILVLVKRRVIIFVLVLVAKIALPVSVMVTFCISIIIL